MKNINSTDIIDDMVKDIKLAKDKHAGTLVLEKVCRTLDCNIDDICEFVLDEGGG